MRKWLFRVRGHGSRSLPEMLPYRSGLLSRHVGPHQATSLSKRDSGSESAGRAIFTDRQSASRQFIRPIRAAELSPRETGNGSRSQGGGSVTDLGIKLVARTHRKSRRKSTISRRQTNRPWLSRGSKLYIRFSPFRKSPDARHFWRRPIDSAMTTERKCKAVTVRGTSGGSGLESHGRRRCSVRIAGCGGSASLPRRNLSHASGSGSASRGRR